MENKPTKRNYNKCRTIGHIAKLYNCDCDVIVRQLQAFPAITEQYNITTEGLKNKAKCYLSFNLVDAIFQALGEP